MSIEGWAIVELMGHRRRAGRVSEVEAFGAKLLRLDVPHEGGETTEFYGGAAIYALRPCSEEIARRVADDLGDPRPVNPVAYRPALPARAADPMREPDDDDGDDFPDDGPELF